MEAFYQFAVALPAVVGLQPSASTDKARPLQFLWIY